MKRIPIWNNGNGQRSPSRFCDAVEVNGKILLEIKYGRNNFQQMPYEEIQKQIRAGMIKEEKKK